MGSMVIDLSCNRMYFGSLESIFKCRGGIIAGNLLASMILPAHAMADGIFELLEHSKQGIMNLGEG